MTGATLLTVVDGKFIGFYGKVSIYSGSDLMEIFGLFWFMILDVFILVGVFDAKDTGFSPTSSLSKTSEGLYLIVLFSFLFFDFSIILDFTSLATLDGAALPVGNFIDS